MSRTSSILRKHRASQKVYVPNEARDNQYIIAEMPLTDKLIELVVGKVDLDLEKPYQNLYQKLAKIAFDAVEECGIEHANFVANSRLVRVRFSEEQQVLPPLNSLFFYSPEHNSTFKGYFDGEQRSKKIKFLFLATGKHLRANSAEFHEITYKAVKIISHRIGLQADELIMRDHQHLTYDVFAKEKGNKGTVTHSFREISARYIHQGYKIEDRHTTVTYAIVHVPMTRRLLKGAKVDYDAVEPFSQLYAQIADTFSNAAKKCNLSHAAMIANGMSPIVRYGESENTITNGEIISLGFNPHNQNPGIVCKWHGDKLIDNIRLIFFAEDSDEVHKTYGRFVNQVTKSITLMANELNWKKDKDDMLMRLHQHLIRYV